VYFESLPPTAPGLDLRRAPLLRAAPAPAPAPAGSSALDALVHARFGAHGPRSALARELWSSAYEQLGKAFVQRAQPGAAVDALREAVALTPGRAAVHSNLGVAYEQQGELARALEQTRLAVDLDPSRPTPWVNLARLVLRVRGPQPAREVLAAAAQRGLTDPRLSALARELRGAPDMAQGTTRK